MFYKRKNLKILRVQKVKSYLMVEIELNIFKQKMFSLISEYPKNFIKIFNFFSNVLYYTNDF